MNKKTAIVPSRDATVSVSVDEATYLATYEVIRNIIVVRSDTGTRSAQVANTPPEIMARMLLRELVQIDKLRRDDFI